MSQGATPITMIGNVVADPELRYTPAGVPVTSFRLASTPRVFNKGSGQWEDGEALFLTCNVWRDLAENTMDTINKGMRVIVWGRLSQSRWTSKTGEKRTAHEIDVDDLGVVREPGADGGVVRRHRGAAGIAAGHAQHAVELDVDGLDAPGRLKLAVGGLGAVADELAAEADRQADGRRERRLPAVDPAAPDHPDGDAVEDR